MLASKSTSVKQLICMLPQSTVSLRVSRNYSMVAYLKTVEIQNCSSSFFLSSGTKVLFQPAYLMLEVTLSKQPSIMGIFPKDGPFVLSL